MTNWMKNARRISEERILKELFFDYIGDGIPVPKKKSVKMEMNKKEKS